MKKAKKENISLILSFFALGISLVVAYCQNRLSKESNELAFNQHLMDNRPMLKLVDVSYELIDVEATFFQYSFSVMPYPPPRVSYKALTTALVRKNFTFINSGNKSAIYLAYLNIDYNVSDPTFLRSQCMRSIKERSLLKGNSDSSRVDIIDSFFQSHIFENDTLKISVVDTLKEERAGRVLLDTNKLYISHFLLLYGNNEGMYFDTFVMTKFRLNSPLLGIQVIPLKTPAFIALKDSVSNYFVKDGPPVFNSKSYGKKESRYLNKFSKQVKKIQDQHYADQY